MKPSPVMNAIFYGLITFGVALVGFAIYLAKPAATTPGPSMESPAPAPVVAAAPVPVASANPLVSMSRSFDFGTISMAAGKVSHRFWIRNTGDSPVTITRLYTSCMCTEATLITPAGSKGPFGMPGHGANAGVFERIAPGGTAQVEAVFDPAAHGPAGIGPTQRIVTIRTAEAAPLDLQFTAMVKP